MPVLERSLAGALGTVAVRAGAFAHGGPTASA